MDNSFSSLNCSRRVLAPAKINLHLEVLGIRSDGFHELAMVMQSINVFDCIDITPTENGLIKLTSNDLTLSTSEDNLILRAANAIRSKAGLNHLGAVIHLTKNIPIGAGLAGGSSDAAATLFGLNSLWKLNFSNDQLAILAAEIGSDVPFCLAGGTQLCFGRGEVLEPLNNFNSSMGVVLVKDPLVEVSTPWAYEIYKKNHQKNYLSAEVDFEVKRKELRDSKWITTTGLNNPPPLTNDLQNVVAPVTPAVEKSLEFLSSLEGSISRAMSGSGPSCFALFPDLLTAQRSLQKRNKELVSLGLNCWCCAFKANGVSFDL